MGAQDGGTRALRQGDSAADACAVERDASYRKRMYEALFRQDFKDVRIRMEPNARLSLTLTSSRISQMSPRGRSRGEDGAAARPSRNH